MSQKKWQPPPQSTSRQNDSKNAQCSLDQTLQDKTMTESDMKNGSIFVKTLVQIDPDSDLFMKVAQNAYADHERNLVQCTKCNRKFFPDRIEKHQVNCAAKKLQSPISQPQKMKSRQTK